MRRRVGLCAAVCLLLFAVVGATLVSSSRPSLPSLPTEPRVSAGDQGRFPVGVSYGDRLVGLAPDKLASALDDAVALDSNWVRLDIQWGRIQPADAGHHDWRALDRVVRAARERRLRVLGIVTYSPPWARDPGCESFSCPPHSAAQFARFAASVAGRYAGQGVHAYEIWNEPNLSKFWVLPDAARYGALLAATTLEMRRADPSATLLFGGLAQVSGVAGSVPAEDFLRQACATDRCAMIDAVAYHPYTYPQLPQVETPGSPWWGLGRADPTPAGLPAVVASLGLTGRDIWVTEYGAPTGGSGEAAGGRPLPGGARTDHVTEHYQAQILVDGLGKAVDSLSVGAFFAYSWQDLGSSEDPEDHFGLRRLDGSRKPSWTAFRAAAQRR